MKGTIPTIRSWKPTRNTNVLADEESDIRFTFSIWHQPAPTTETTHARSQVQPVARAAPFTWLPLLPFEPAQELASVWPLVGRGIPLSSDLPADNVDIIRRASSLRSPSTDDSATDSVEPAKKKQKVRTLGEGRLESAIIARTRNEKPTSQSGRAGSHRRLAIHRVRTRDVDIVEDFLDKYLPEFGTGVPLRILLGTSGVAALAIQAEPTHNDLPEPILDPSVHHARPLERSSPILALVIYRKTRSGSESVISHMQAIAVHPASRRLGLGRQLVSEALKDSIQEAQAQEDSTLTLRAEGYEGNGSREFWQRSVAGLKVSSRRLGCRRGWAGEAQLPCVV
ncbi:hypothetical protein QFC19_004986 [Naganishia cerealis]|uniref:Uncharacterized protein n=1 Tax=Naganishia cerealis TaxID=610337 RepID=A0ACC2VTD9_9TREE|nr:hypothetical protein QFC19_004986 [Naganishia cerealis]